MASAIWEIRDDTVQHAMLRLWCDGCGRLLASYRVPAAAAQWAGPAGGTAQKVLARRDVVAIERGCLAGHQCGGSGAGGSVGSA